MLLDQIKVVGAIGIAWMISSFVGGLLNLPVVALLIALVGGYAVAKSDTWERVMTHNHANLQGLFVTVRSGTFLKFMALFLVGLWVCGALLSYLLIPAQAHIVLGMLGVLVAPNIRQFRYSSVREGKETAK